MKLTSAHLSSILLLQQIINIISISALQSYKSKLFNETVLYFYKRKFPQTYQSKIQNTLKYPFGKDFCYYACNQKTSECQISLFDKKLFSLNEQTSQLIKKTSYLETISFFPHPSNENYNLKVYCQNCQGYTEGSRCSECQRGYYDTYQENRIQRILLAKKEKENQNQNGQILDYSNPAILSLQNRILQLEINCEPCNCLPEGSHSYICNQKTKYARNSQPLNYLQRMIQKKQIILTPDQKSYLQNNAIISKAGQCNCRPGYLSKSPEKSKSSRSSSSNNYKTCSQCDLIKKYLVHKNPYAKTWKIWQTKNRKDDEKRQTFGLIGQRNMSSLDLKCVNRCDNDFDCNENDKGAICHRKGYCQCSIDLYGPYCEYFKIGGGAKAVSKSVYSSVAIYFILQVVQVNILWFYNLIIYKL